MRQHIVGDSCVDRVTVETEISYVCDADLDPFVQAFLYREATCGVDERRVSIYTEQATTMTEPSTKRTGYDSGPAADV